MKGKKYVAQNKPITSYVMTCRSCFDGCHKWILNFQVPHAVTHCCTSIDYIRTPKSLAITLHQKHSIIHILDATCNMCDISFFEGSIKTNSMRRVFNIMKYNFITHELMIITHSSYINIKIFPWKILPCVYVSRYIFHVQIRTNGTCEPFATSQYFVACSFFSWKQHAEEYISAVYWSNRYYQVWFTAVHQAIRTSERDAATEMHNNHRSAASLPLTSTRANTT